MISVLDAEGADAVRKAAASDLCASRNEFLFPLPSFLQKQVIPWLSSPRDLPILYLFYNICIVTLPAALALYILAPSSHLAGAVYFALNYAVFLQRFMLALHYSEHRRLFRSGYGALNYVAPVVLAPFLGVPSGMYRLHHCVMHHTGNNKRSNDASSTEPYLRYNPLHFLIYWARHAILGPIEVPLVAAKNKRWGLLAACLFTETAYVAAIAGLRSIAPAATLWVFIVPYIVSSLALMFGNWSQHVFIDPSRPRSNHGLTYNCVGCSDNKKSFNDGYHIVHHNNSQVHWADLPSKFVATLEEHGREDALVFVGIGFFEVGAAVMGQKWGFLVRHLAKYTKKFAAMSDEQLAQELQRRLKPIVG